MQNEVIAVFGLDAAYAPHAGAVMRSAVRNAPGARFTFYVLQHGVPDGERRKLEACAPETSVVWVEAAPERFASARMTLAHVSRATFYRLLIPELLDVPRVVYLDADLIVCGDLRELFAVDLNGAALAAVCDASLDPRAFARNFGFPELDARYFNAGVLVMDLERLRRDRFQERAAAVMNEYGDRLTYQDQDVMNCVAFGAWRELDPAWNVQRIMVAPVEDPEVVCPPALHAAGRAKPRIIHYTTRHKPWNRDAYHPYAGAYWDAIAGSPFEAAVAAASGVSTARRLFWRARWRAYQAKFAIDALLKRPDPRANAGPTPAQAPTPIGT